VKVAKSVYIFSNVYAFCEDGEKILSTINPHVCLCFIYERKILKDVDFGD